MLVFNLEEKEVFLYEKLKLSTNITNTQGLMLHMPSSLDEVKRILKMLIADNDYMLNKVYTIASLIEQQKTMAVPELVYPDGIAMMNNETVGFTMPYVEGTNLKTVLKNTRIPYEEKRKYLIQIGELLEKLKFVRKHTDFKNFYLNDIHEANFLVEKATGHIRFVDLDSCAIKSNLVDRSMYLRPYMKFNNLGLEEKYPQENSGFFGTHLIPNENTDLYCYLIMILNFISRENLSLLTPQELANYLDYLELKGYPIKLLECLSLLYKPEDNINPYEALQDLSQVPNDSFVSYLRALRK